MAAALPIRFQKITELVGPVTQIQPASIGFATVTMESEKYVCVRETAQDKAAVVVVDLANPNSQPTRRPISADSALMNPEDNILALKAGNQLQVFNISAKTKLKAYTMTEEVVFWKWLNGNVMGLVTKGAVYHWALDSKDDAPVKVFDRHQSLTDCQIINYRADAALKWLTLVGIAQREGRIAGAMQLYSVERRVSQAIEGHAAAFAQFQVEGAPTQSTVFAFANRGAAAAKLYIIEVGKADEAAPGFTKKAVDIYFPPEAAGDFPVSMQISEKYNIIYLVTKLGFFHMFDLETGTCIYRNRISSDTIFTTALYRPTGGIIGIDKKGQVLVVTPDDATIVQFICQSLNDYALAIKLASKANLPGADDLFANQFNKLFSSGMYKEAAKVACDSPNGNLRTPKTIQMFQQAPPIPNQPSPLLQYFGVLLEKGKLNKVESIELVRPVVQQGRFELLENWLKEDKLGCSEELGDMVRRGNLKLALIIYNRAQAHAKVVQCFAESGEFDKIFAYANQVSYKPDYQSVLNSLVAINPQAATQFAAKLAASGVSSGIDINATIDGLIARGMIQDATSLLLDVLKNNKPEDGPMQTKLLEINLKAAPQVADAILANEMFSHYDRVRIGHLCEQSGLFQRALEHYSDTNDIKRVLANTHLLNPEFVVNYFARLSAEDALDCLRHLMRINPRNNLQLVVMTCTKYLEQLGSDRVIELLESFGAIEGMFRVLGAVINISQDPIVHNKYVEAAAKTGQFREVERVVRESNYYDPEKVRDFLKEAKLQEQLPLIIVCDRFEFVDDMTRYLYKNNLSRYIEAYVQKINPINTPIVVAALIDVGCNEDYIKNLILSVRNLCPVDPLVEAVEKRHKLKLILPWLEQRIQEGNQEPGLHNTLAKIYIDANKEPENFLLNNSYYDSLVVGKYCEKRDPHLAFIAYKRGRCDRELIDVTNKNGLFKQQARYLVERQDPQLWSMVLTNENEYKRQIVDQVVSTALPETKNPDEVSSTVKAFMVANLPNELMHLLEKIVLESKNSDFSENKNLQNLLIITAVKAEPTKVADYITRLDKYDAMDIATVCIDESLHEEAFVIYKKFNQPVSAIAVLLDHLHNLERAFEYAERVASPECYSRLAKAQLNGGYVKEAIASYIKADDPEFYDQVIFVANSGQFHEQLVKYLEMCIKKIKEPRLESELVYAYAKTGKDAELETFISNPSCCANLLDTGDRCFNEGLYTAAKILFNSVSNYGKLASALVKLGEFSAAVESARKANSIRTWKEVNLACVDAKEFSLAQSAGLHIVIQPDELEELITVYETRGYFEELIAVLESAMSTDRTHVGLFTELAGLYSKYKEEKLMEFLRLQWNRISIPKVINYTQLNRQWAELTFLYTHYDEFDQAALTMINHPEAWEHPLFKDVIAKVNNTDICYKAVQFYLDYEPTAANDLMTAMLNQVDHTRVVSIARRADKVSLMKPYLLSVQERNVQAVNEALNELHIDSEDFEALRSSTDKFDAFDSVALAQRLEKHELLEFRRIAAHLYKKNARFAQAIDLLKTDKLYKDAIQVAAESKKQDVCEDLLKYFTEIKQSECFAAALYTTYDAIRPDVVLELAWRNQILDFAFPYFIQVMREYITKVDALTEAAKPKEKKADGPDSFHQPPAVEQAYAPAIPQIAYYPDPAQMYGGAIPPQQPYGGYPPNMGFGGGF
eukprot:TRINITY_DN3136_c0_g1_i1.p1 TRINITY_DN3136_c0_g1~~TRINITY_DN3136_c0_g1_i1.p1  ORF type:complete len:1727 (-),score=785.73 TRINITY_DN3136_c0_g1_i1:319-5382(-)